MAKISIKAMIVSNIADTLITFVPFLSVGLYIVFSVIKPGMSAYEIARAETAEFSNIFAYHQALFNIVYFLGMVSTIIAGYIAARIAKRALILNALLSSASCVISGILHNKEIVLIALTPALAMLGGYLYSKQISRKG